MKVLILLFFMGFALGISAQNTSQKVPFWNHKDTTKLTLNFVPEEFRPKIKLYPYVEYIADTLNISSESLEIRHYNTLHQYLKFNDTILPKQLKLVKKVKEK